MTQVLLTNDDGVGAGGLVALRGALIDAGMDVTVIAPRGERSGHGRATTIHHAVDVDRVDDDDGHSVFSCTGTPVDCVRIGVFSNEFPPPDVVVSGINHGCNLGDDATYSGTLGAALEAALLGLPAVAFSQQPGDAGETMRTTAPLRFEQAWLAPFLVREIARRPPPMRVIASVNFPDVLRERRAMVTRAGTMTYDGRWMRPERRTRDGSRYWPYLGPHDPEPRPEQADGTDFAALAAGRISITPVGAGLVDEAHGEERGRWATSLTDLVARALRRQSL